MRALAGARSEQVVSSHFRRSGGGEDLGDQRPAHRRCIGELATDRIEQLESIGFIWKPVSNCWDDMFKRLQTYHALHGDCLVPTRYKKDPALGQWVRRQRNRNKASTLPVDQKAKLDSIGFVWEPLLLGPRKKIL